MQFVVIARDGTDEKALERRLAVREKHLALGDKMRDEGTLLYACAILDETEKMVGSIMIVQFADRGQLDDWLKIEPYVTGGVWQDIDVQLCRVGPSFAALRA